MRTPLQPKNATNSNNNYSSKDEVNNRFITPLKTKEDFQINTNVKLKDEEIKTKTKNQINNEFKIYEALKLDNKSESNEEKDDYFYNLDKNCKHENDFNIFTPEIKIENAPINKEDIYSNSSTAHKSLSSDDKQNKNTELDNAINFFENEGFMCLSESDVKLSGKINAFIKSNLEYYDN
jgi:hypothetical protein